MDEGAEEVKVEDTAIGKLAKDKSGFEGRVDRRRKHSPGRQQLFLVPEKETGIDGEWFDEVDEGEE